MTAKAQERAIKRSSILDASLCPPATCISVVLSIQRTCLEALPSPSCFSSPPSFRASSNPYLLHCNQRQRCLSARAQAWRPGSWVQILSLSVKEAEEQTIKL